MKEYIAKNNDFSEYDNDPEFTLEKIDRNNTHHYVVRRCPKCGGKGYIDYFSHIQGGVCYLCGGSGVHEQRVIVRTEDYAKKLESKRIAAARKAAIEKNKVFLEKEGFTPDGKTYMVLGNTWAIKSELKDAGAFYCAQLGWHFNHPVENYPTIELDINTPITYEDADPIYLLSVDPTSGAYGYHDFYSYIIESYIKDIRNKYEEQNAPETHWFGEVKQRVTLTGCNVHKVASWDNMYGTTNLYNITTEDGYVFTWKTGSYIEDGHKDCITGTIKAHTEYKGIKQTELTRCKVS